MSLEAASDGSKYLDTWGVNQWMGLFGSLPCMKENQSQPTDGRSLFLSIYIFLNNKHSKKQSANLHFQKLSLHISTPPLGWGLTGEKLDVMRPRSLPGAELKLELGSEFHFQNAEVSEGV